MIVAFNLSYYVRGATADQAVLVNLRTAFERAAEDIKRPGRFVGPRLFKALEKALGEQFKGEGIGPRRGKWAPLSPRYAEWKRKRFGNKPILVRTGALKEALTRRDSGYALREASDMSVTFGTRGVEYANYHQLGTERGLPDRPLFDFTPAQEKAIKDAVRLGILDAIKAARLEEAGARVKPSKEEGE